MKVSYTHAHTHNIKNRPDHGFQTWLTSSPTATLQAAMSDVTIATDNMADNEICRPSFELWTLSSDVRGRSVEKAFQL